MGVPAPCSLRSSEKVTPSCGGSKRPPSCSTRSSWRRSTARPLGESGSEPARRGSIASSQRRAREPEARSEAVRRAAIRQGVTGRRVSRTIKQMAWAKIRSEVGDLSAHVAEFLNTPRAVASPAEEDTAPRAAGEIRVGAASEDLGGV